MHFYHNLEFKPIDQNRPFLAINMVASLDGKVTSGGALKPGSIGSSFDRQTMNVLRSHFDAVLAGGNTIRQHPYYLGVPSEFEAWRVQNGLKAQPLTILLTRTGKLNPETPLFTNPPRPPLIVTTKEGALNLHPSIRDIAMIEIGEKDQDLKKLLQVLLSKHKINKLLIEGGPSINYQFLQARLPDEVFLTLAPKLIGATSDLTLVMGDSVLPKNNKITLISSFQQADELFLRYKIEWL